MDGPLLLFPLALLVVPLDIPLRLSVDSMDERLLLLYAQAQPLPQNKTSRI